MPEKVLLINPPVYDTRFHWDKWHQPTRLLRLATHFRRSAVDVKLIDTLYTPSDEPLKRKRVAFLPLDGLNVPKWRYGMPTSAFTAQLKELAKSGWIPDEIYVEGFTTFWWEGVEEA